MPPAKSMKRLPSTSSMIAPSARAAKTFMVELTPRATNCWWRASKARDFSPGIPRYGIVSDIKTSWFGKTARVRGVLVLRHHLSALFYHIRRAHWRCGQEKFTDAKRGKVCYNSQHVCKCFVRASWRMEGSAL